MQRLALIRVAVLIVMRDVLIPCGGLFLAIYLPLSHGLSPWHLPLIAGMIGTPLVARGGGPPEDRGGTVLPLVEEALKHLPEFPDGEHPES